MTEQVCSLVRTMGGGASKTHKVNVKANVETSSIEEHSKPEAKISDSRDSVGRHMSPRRTHEAPSHGLSPNNQEERGSVEDSFGDHDDELGHEEYGDEDMEDDMLDEYNDGESEEEEEETEEAMQMRMLFAQSAMSMDMDNEDLIFNLLYFGDSNTNFASMMNSAAEETVAAHSQGNTPYKLTPATDNALKALKVITVTEILMEELQLQDCLICQEEMTVNDSVVLLPGCNHCFHNNCVLKWFSLQSWCPVCRAKIIPDDTNNTDQIDRIVEGENEDESPRALKISAREETLGSVKSSLGGRFNDVADERGDETVDGDSQVK